MPVIALILSLAGAAVFFVSGTSKLLDQKQTGQTLREFGLPVSLVPPAVLILPLIELAVGAALLIPKLASWGAWGILLLLILFTVVLSVSLAKGVRPACHCFGQLSSAPISWRTLLRNALLIGMTVMLIWSGPETGLAAATTILARLSPQIWIALGLSALFLLVTGVLFWLFWLLWRQNGRLLLRIEALETALGGRRSFNQATANVGDPRSAVGVRAPGFELPTAGGTLDSLDGLLAAGRSVLLIFVDANCGPCQELLPEIIGWQQHLGNLLTIAVVGSGWKKKDLRRVTGVGNLFLQKKREVAERYGVTGTPAAVLIRPDGALVSGIATGKEGVRQMLQAALARIPQQQASGSGGNGRSGALPAQKAEVATGQSVPAVQLRDLDGALVNLGDFLVKETLMLFWSPSCGFCQRMLPDLKDWERKRPVGAPALLVISTGSTAANLAMKLASPILLDDGFRTGRLFGAAGTPSAVLVDQEGKIASDVVVGGPAVLALAGVKEEHNERAV